MTQEIGKTALESISFPIAFISRLAERESWRKEIHRPVMHMHKWWAKRLGSVFRGILLGAASEEHEDVAEAFYRQHKRTDLVVFDPFMGSGTTLVEAHKLGMVALGMDINPVAVRSVETALGPMNLHKLEDAMRLLDRGIGERIRALYRTTDSRGRPATTLYNFWVMQVPCPSCTTQVDLFSNFVVARNAYPQRKPETQVVSPCCGEIFESIYGRTEESCPNCKGAFNPQIGPVGRTKTICPHCSSSFAIVKAMDALKRPPSFRQFGKLVLLPNGSKQYLNATGEDLTAYARCSTLLEQELSAGRLSVPSLQLDEGYNTKQALRYNFRTWRDFFNDRQLLALSWLRAAIDDIDDEDTRRVFTTLHSGTLEFNNMFASYKGEGTGAIRHMFSHHILKPERTPIEGNIWGTRKSSGSFSGLFRSRVLRAIEYRERPRELRVTGPPVVSSLPFHGRFNPWPTNGTLPVDGVAIRCGDSAVSRLVAESVDLVITDPPFFDNVHYAELADFFQAWHKDGNKQAATTTRNTREVQDPEKLRFTAKLCGVFQECHRVLKDDGVMAFTYHHSRSDGWEAVSKAILDAGFTVTASQPVKSEMSVATPKAAAKEPIQLDIVVVCRKAASGSFLKPTPAEAAVLATEQEFILEQAGFKLSRNDSLVIRSGQALTTIETPMQIARLFRGIQPEKRIEAPLEAFG